jgi:DNA-binding transcriptional LysR family regulator
MTIKDIEILLMLYREKNITRASEKLYISQPALTKRIKKLEEDFNTPLVIRTPKGILFTPQGEKLIAHFEKLKVSLQAMKDDISSSLHEIQGSLRLGVSSIFAHYELPSILKGYLEKYPKVELSIETGHSSGIYKCLQADRISAAIIRHSYGWEGERLLLSCEPICIASSKKASLDDLLSLPYIQYRTDLSLQYQIEQWCNENFIKSPKVGISTSTMDTCVQLVKQGVGWSILPSIGLKQFDGYTENLFWKDGSPFDRETWLYYKKEYLGLSTVSSFIDFIQSYH